MQSFSSSVFEMPKVHLFCTRNTDFGASEWLSNAFIKLMVNYNYINRTLVSMGRGGALVKSMTLNRRVVGLTPALAAIYGPWTSPLLTVACALRCETPIQYPCCSRECL